jgi:hypothetical protein
VRLAAVLLSSAAASAAVAAFAGVWGGKPPASSDAPAAFASPCAALPPLPADAVNGAGGHPFFAAPAPPAGRGSRSGDGSRERPWDLATALASERVRGGDTVWLEPGVYRGPFASRLTGSRGRPVVVRGDPGRRVALDGEGARDPVLTINGGFTVYRDFEVFNSRPSAATDSSNVVARGPGTRLVDLVIHDASSQGIGLWSEAPDSAVEGCLLFDNGRHVNKDHGIYSQNRDGAKAIRGNVIVRSRAYGIHVYGSGAARLDNFCVEGNVLLDNGALVAGSSRSNAIFGGSAPMRSLEVRDNDFIETAGGNTNVRLGYGGDARGLDVRGNRFVGGDPAVFVDGWKAPIRFDGNVVAGPVRWRDTEEADRSRAFAERASLAPQVFVRRDPYDPGRARILVYRPRDGGPASISVDLAPYLPHGAPFTIADALDWSGPPAVASTYSGGEVAIPLHGPRPIRPAGLEAAEVAPPETPAASVFLLRAGGARP